MLAGQQGNAYAGGRGTRFSCTRYGNVFASRGSVIELFLEQKHNSFITITDERMTRFWLTLEQGVRFVINCIAKMQGEEIFIPKIPSMKVIDLARAIAPEAEIEVVGIRPGEKLHEVLISEDEARATLELEDMYIVQPASEAANELWFGRDWQAHGQPLPDGYRYASNNNEDWLDIDQIRQILAPIEAAHLRRTDP